MIIKFYKLNNQTIMHVRPAGMIADIVNKYESSVKIFYKDKVADARSVLSILSLGIGDDAKLKIVIEGEDEEEVLKELDKLIIERNFDENTYTE